MQCGAVKTLVEICMEAFHKIGDMAELVKAASGA